MPIVIKPTRKGRDAMGGVVDMTRSIMINPETGE
tara:strand:- start:2036 stop:2137 length:102 start_codon:yes stop_codon:yes gene_type:complete